MQGGGGANPRPGRMGGGAGRGFIATAAVAAVATVAGMAAADHIRAQEEGRESGVQAAVRWFTQDILGVQDGSGSSSGPSGRRRPGMSRAELDALPVRTLRARDIDQAQAEGTTDPEKQMCAICQDNFVAEDTLMRLPCLHEYHEDCIVSFLSSAAQPICPCCRHPVHIQ